MIRLLFAILLGVFTSVPSFATEKSEISCGLKFYSHQVSKENRTSAYFEDNTPFRFKDYFNVQFDLRPYPNRKGYFGHVCEIIFDEDHFIDLLFTVNYREGGSLSVIYDHDLLLQKKIDVLDAENVRWSHVSFSFLPKEDRFIVSLDGQDVSAVHKFDRSHEVSIGFGARNIHSSKDVAAFIMKDLSVSEKKGEITYEWPLSEHGEGYASDSRQGLRLLTDNPFWIHDLHSVWTHEDSFSLGRSYLVKGIEDRALIVSSDTLYSYSFKTGKLDRTYYRSPLVNFNRTSNQFIWNPDSCNVVFSNPHPAYAAYSRFDNRTGIWEPDFSSDDLWNVQNCILYQNGRFYHFFGYGHHEYSDDMYVRNVDGSIDSIANTIDITPRYLSAIGNFQNKIYLCSGVGNAYGAQMMGTEIQKDLYSYDPVSGQFDKLEGVILPDDEIASQNLFFQDSTSFYSLFFNPFRDQSYLVLKKIFLDGREPVDYCDTIPYKFYDMSSGARLYRTQEKIYAVTKHQSGPDRFEFNIYSILRPVLPQPVQEQNSEAGWIWYLISAVVFIMAVGGWYLFHRLHGKSAHHPEVRSSISQTLVESVPDHASSESVEEKSLSPGIYLLGGFRVIDKDSNDITGEFTPVMKQLLSLIILYTVKDDRGVSNSKLKDLLWMDKSDESAINNRSVNIRKIRLRLDNVADFRLTPKNSYWKFVMPENGVCDVMNIYPFLEHVNSGDIAISGKVIDDLLKIASLGVLLPNQNLDFFDDFKSAYSNLVMDAMNKAIAVTVDDNMRLSLSKAILKFSPLDENAIYEECISLINLGKIGLAKSSFDSFCKEYEVMMGEKFEDDFECFVRK